MKTGEESLVTDFLSPEKLWNKTFAEQNEWREKFANIPFEDKTELGSSDIIRKLQSKIRSKLLQMVKNVFYLRLQQEQGKRQLLFKLLGNCFKLVGI